MSDSKYYAATRRLRHAEGAQQFHIDVFGDYLAQKHKYKSHSGIDAVRFFLVEKYHWLPAEVKALNTEDLLFLLGEEMHGWKLPAAAIASEKE